MTADPLMEDPVTGTPVPDGPVVAVPSVFTGTAVALGALSAVVFGIVPGPLLSLANHAATQLFVR